MRHFLFSGLALLFVLAAAMPAEARMSLHGSAGSLMERTLLRRAARLSDRSMTRSHSSASSSSRSSVTHSSQITRRDVRRKQRMDAVDDESIQGKLLAAINMERALSAHIALTSNAKLALAAQRHAEDMIARGYFEHENPEGLRVGERVRATGYADIDAQECRCSYKISIGENLAKGQHTVNHVIQSWLASPSHREALLSDTYTEVGIGIAGDVWVLNFGAIEINNETSQQ